MQNNSNEKNMAADTGTAPERNETSDNRNSDNEMEYFTGKTGICTKFKKKCKKAYKNNNKKKSVWCIFYIID